MILTSCKLFPPSAGCPTNLWSVIRMDGRCHWRSDSPPNFPPVVVNCTVLQIENGIFSRVPIVSFGVESWCFIQICRQAAVNTSDASVGRTQLWRRQKLVGNDDRKKGKPIKWSYDDQFNSFTDTNSSMYICYQTCFEFVICCCHLAQMNGIKARNLGRWCFQRESQFVKWDSWNSKVNCLW